MGLSGACSKDSVTAYIMTLKIIKIAVLHVKIAKRAAMQGPQALDRVLFHQLFYKIEPASQSDSV